MTKTDAIRMFGGRQQDLADAIGITRSAVAQWPETLRQDQVDRVLGAAIRLGVVRCQDSGAQECHG